MSVEGSSKAYRERLHTSNPPCIPYLYESIFFANISNQLYYKSGTYLSDLTFIDEGNPDTLPPHKLINFSKRLLTYRAISEIQRYQNEAYKLRPVDNIIKLIETIKGPTDEKEFEKQMYAESLAREPRGVDKVP